MKSPWKDIDDAFCPMFDESVIVRGQRNNKEFSQTIKAFVSSDTTADAYTENAMDTDAEHIDVVFSRKDWAFVQKLLRGDEIERTCVNGLKYRIQEVKNDAIMGWVIKARSI